MIDQGLEDDKILAVAENDANTRHLNDIRELAGHFKLELKEFFESYKRLENKTVTVPDFQGKDVALEVVSRALSFYKTKY
jgi:inorganic pyrophosphatase